MKAAQHIELFRCEPLRARISAKQCGANYRAANGRVVMGSGSREIGLGPCKRCEIGRKNSGGWKDPRELPKLKGTRQERIQQGTEILLKKDMPITIVERMARVKPGALRYHIERLGHDPREWPHARTYMMSRSEAKKEIANG